MLERQYRLQYPGVDYTWGGIDPVGDPFRLFRGRTRTIAVEWTDTELTLEDTDRPRQDGRRFGQDYRRGATGTFTLGARGVTGSKAAAEASVRQLMREQARAWRGDGVRMIPGAMAQLTTMQDGRELTTYGRPRRWAPNYAQIHAGEATAVATFDTWSDAWYGAEQQVRIDIVPPTSTGGVTLPVSLPHTLSSGSVASSDIMVAGVLPAPVAAEIHGPIVNPVVQLAGGWELRLTGTLVAGQTVTADARPWVRTILTDTGASWAGTGLNRLYSRLAELELQPGPANITLQGTDPTGTAYVVLRWTPAHASMV